MNQFVIIIFIITVILLLIQLHKVKVQLSNTKDALYKEHNLTLEYKRDKETKELILNKVETRNIKYKVLIYHLLTDLLTDKSITLNNKFPFEFSDKLLNSENPLNSIRFKIKDNKVEIFENGKINPTKEYIKLKDIPFIHPEHKELYHRLYKSLGYSEREARKTLNESINDIINNK